MICFIWQLGLGCVLCTHREQYSCQFSLQEVNIWRFPSFGIHKSPKLLSTANRKWVKNFIIPNFVINPSIRRRCDNTIFEFFIHCINLLLCILEDSHWRQICTIYFCIKAFRNARLLITSWYNGNSICASIIIVVSDTISDHTGVLSLVIVSDTWY